MTTETKEVKAVEIKPEILELSKKYSDVIAISIDPNDPTRGLAVINNPEGKHVFADNLVEGLTPELYRKVQTNDSAHLAASAHAFGHEAINFLKKHKAVESVTFEAQTVGKDSFTGEVLRTQVSALPGSKTGETITKHGALNTFKHKVHGTGNVGEFKKVKLDLANTGAKHLAGK